MQHHLVTLQRESLAASMYQGGVDVIFHASGGTGAGVFKQKAINEQLNEADLADKKFGLSV